MDTIVLPLFFGLLGICILELIVSGLWSKVYFLYGIAVFHETLKIENSPEIERIFNTLEYQFETDKYLKSLNANNLMIMQSPFERKYLILVLWG